MHTPLESYQTTPQLGHGAIDASNYHSYQPLLGQQQKFHQQRLHNNKNLATSSKCYSFCCRIFVRKYKERSKRIDVVSRLVIILIFMLSFLVNLQPNRYLVSLLILKSFFLLLKYK